MIWQLQRKNAFSQWLTLWVRKRFPRCQIQAYQCTICGKPAAWAKTVKYLVSLGFLCSGAAWSEFLHSKSPPFYTSYLRQPPVAFSNWAMLIYSYFYEQLLDFYTRFICVLSGRVGYVSIGKDHREIMFLPPVYSSSCVNLGSKKTSLFICFHS